MPRLNLLVAAQFASVDQFSNGLSLTNVVDEITVPHDLKVPKKGSAHPIGPGFVVVTVWSRLKAGREEKLTGRLRVLSPSGRELAVGSFTALMVKRRLRHISRFAVFPYTGTGDYKIQAQLLSGRRWREVGNLTIDVKQAPKPPAAAEIIH
jgi:hypothetical protein